MSPEGLQLFTHHASVTGWNQTRSLASVPTGASLSSPTSFTVIYMNTSPISFSLRHASLVFSVLCFCFLLSLQSEVQEFDQNRRIQGPFVHSSGHIKTGILGCPTCSQISRVTLLRLQNLDPPVVS